MTRYAKHYSVTYSAMYKRLTKQVASTAAESKTKFRLSSTAVTNCIARELSVALYPTQYNVSHNALVTPPSRILRDKLHERLHNITGLPTKFCLYETTTKTSVCSKPYTIPLQGFCFGIYKLQTVLSCSRSRLKNIFTLAVFKYCKLLQRVYISVM